LYDAIVVGLGPGGSVAARTLAEHGMRVLAFDKDHMPRYKPCGGALSARVLQELRVDLTPVIQATIYEGAFTFRGAEPFAARFHKPVVYMVMRPQFDHLLSQQAYAAGVDMREGERVHTIRPRDADVEIMTTRGVYRAPWLIGADGATGAVRSYVARAHAAAPIAGLETEITTDRRHLQYYADRVALDFGNMPCGYSWIFPKQAHLSVGTAGSLRQVVRPRQMLGRFLATHGLCASPGEKVHGHLIPTFTGHHLPVQRHRILLIGDAARLVDPFLGEGIYYDVKSAQIASQTLVDCASCPVEVGRQYEQRLSEVTAELHAALQVARLVYRFPHYGYHLFKTHSTLVQNYFRVLCGENSFAQFSRLLRRQAFHDVVSYSLKLWSSAWRQRVGRS
jgi:geranylgeranyl reductase family protein